MSETDLIKDIWPSAAEKDIRDKRTAKLTSALYLVTNFLSDNDPVKWKLRKTALEVMLTHEDVLSYINNLLKLIDVAFYDRGASPMNLSILRQEYLSLSDLVKQQTNGLSLMLEIPSSPSSSKGISPKIKKTFISPQTFVSKTDRQTVILNCLKSGVWLSIKDIAKNLPDFSGKTVQRELNALTEAGLIKKTGERRWSRYTKV